VAAIQANVSSGCPGYVAHAERSRQSWSQQKPVRRAHERNDETIARWLTQDYPAIVRDAKREGATIYWGDEMGLRSDHVTGTSYAPVG